MPVKASDILADFDKQKPANKTVPEKSNVTANDILGEFDAIEKKNGGVNTSVQSNLSSAPVSPIQSTLPLAGNVKLPNDPFDTSTLFTNPTIANLDPVERKKLNAQLPGLTSPEKTTEVIKSLIDQRKNPGVRITNAQEFISDDLDQNSDLYKGVPNPDVYKQQVLNGEAGSNINVARYFHQRNDQIDKQINDLKNQQTVDAGTMQVTAPNYDELQAQINNLSNYKGQLARSTNALQGYQAAKQVAPPADKSITAQKDYNRKIGLSIQDVNAPIASELKRKNIESSIDATRHPEIVDMENYRLESDGLSARQFAVSADYNLGKISHADYIAQMNEITNQTNQLFDLHPQAKKVMQAQALGQVIQQNREARDAKIPILVKPGSVWENVVNYGISESDIQAAGKQMGLSDADIKTQINNKDDIPGTSFLANVYNKFIVHSSEDLLSPLASLVQHGRLRTDAEVEAERHRTDQQYQFNASQQFNQPGTVIDTNKTIKENGKTVDNPNFLQQIVNPNEGNHNWGYGTLNGFGDALGTLGQLWLTTELTGSLGDAALGSTIGAEVIGANRTASALTEATAFTAKQKALFGNVTGMMLTGYNENKAAAKEFIGEKEGGENAQNLYAITRSMETGLLFGMGFSPQTLIAKAVGRAEKQAAAKEFADLIPNGVENLSEKSWSDYLKNNLIARVGIEGLQENTKAATMMAIDQAVGIGTQAMFNPQSVDSKNLGHDLLSAGIHNFLTFAPISFFGAGVSAIKNTHLSQSRLEQESIYRAGLDPVQYKDYVDQQVASGTVQQGEANQRIQLVNTMSEIQKGVPEDLSRSEKIEFANNVLYEKKYLAEINLLSSKPLIDRKEAQIKALQARQEEILKNSTGAERDANGNLIIKSNEIIQNETANNTDTQTKDSQGKTTENTAAISNSEKAKAAENIVVDEQTKALLEPHKDMAILSDMKTDAERLKFIAEQAQNISPTGEKMQGDAYLSTVDAFGDKLVTKAIELFPEEKLTASFDFNNLNKETGTKISPVLDRINNADYINEKELNSAADELYNLLDKSEKSSLTDEQKSSTANLIEPLIQKIEGYEFRTKTEISTVTEKVPVQVASEVKKRTQATNPALEQLNGSAATITKPDGSKSTGQLRLNDGNYELVNDVGEKISSFGEKAINDRDITLPPIEEMANPVELDDNGNVKSITLKTRDGNLLTVNNPEKALDLAIQLSANVIDVPMQTFDTVYKEIQREIQKEVPVKDISSSKNTQNENVQKITDATTDTQGSSQQKVKNETGQTGNEVPGQQVSVPGKEKVGTATTETGANIKDQQNTGNTGNSIKETTASTGNAKPSVDESPSDVNALKEMASNIPNDGQLREYASKGTIEKYHKETPENAQGIIVQELTPALQHGEDVIDRAKGIFGEKEYVDKTLQFIEESKLPTQNKALMYISLENDLARQKLLNPDSLDIQKRQDLVRSKSQAFLREASLAINFGKLRKIGEVGYDISKVTDHFFSSKEKEEKAIVEKSIEANADTINKEAEKIESAHIDIEQKINEAVESEIAKIHEKLPTERKKKADKAIEALEGFQKKIRSRTYDATLGIPAALVDSGITIIKRAIKAGVAIADAIDLGIQHIKEKYGKEWMKEGDFRSDMIAGFRDAGIKKEASGTPNKVIKDALIESGFGREITVNTKNGKEKRTILDWKKLAGEEGSIDKMKENVNNVFEKRGYSKDEIFEMQKDLTEQYNDLRASVIEHSINELNKRNQKLVTADQKSAARKLSELYNYGLFEKDPAQYDVLLGKAIGIDRLNPERFKQAHELGKALEILYSSKFNGKKLNDLELKTAVQQIEEKMRIILHAEAGQHGSRALQIADIVRTYMDASQRMILNSLGQAVQNPLSGLEQQTISNIDRLLDNSSTKELGAQRRKIASAVYKDMVVNNGVNYGDVNTTFVSRGGLDHYIGNLSDSKIVQGVASTLIGKTTLDAADSYFKSKLTDQKFTYNLIKVLTKNRLVDGKLVNGMSKQDAVNYVSEKLTGQSFDAAKKTAKEIIDKVNSGNNKIVGDSNAAVDRLANDIVKAALVNGSVITSDQVSASYNAAYKSAGRSLGHVANNPLSEMVQGLSGKIEKKINDAIKEKQYKKAAFLTYQSIFFRNILNPFVGGGTNWVVLKLEKNGLGLASGLYNGGREKLDLTSDTGIKKAEKALFEAARDRDAFARGIIGGAAALISSLLWYNNVDEFRKWRNNNKWASKYTDNVTPEEVLAVIAARNKEMGYYIGTLINKNDAYDKSAKAIKGVDNLSKGKTDKAWGQLGEAVGGNFGLPLPWRLVRDGQNIVLGAKGKEPYKVSSKPSEGFWEGWLKAGMVDYIKNNPAIK